MLRGWRDSRLASLGPTPRWLVEASLVRGGCRFAGTFRTPAATASSGSARIDEAAHAEAERLAPFAGMDEAERRSIVSLPASVGRLSSLKELVLYGSSLVRLPRELARCTDLWMLDVYRSPELHWFPHEIARCPSLTKSRASTRVLYGNYKHRPPFPRLDAPPDDPEAASIAQALWGPPRWQCCGCDAEFEAHMPSRYWVSARVATDVMPLLAAVCSDACVDRVASPAPNYVDHAHQGGDRIRQPPPAVSRRSGAQ